MSFILYKDVIRELGIKFNYDAVVHILSNPYAEKSNKVVDEANPFNVSVNKINNKPKRLTIKDLADFGLDVPNNL